MSYDNDQLCRIIEGAILAAGEPLSVDRLHGLFEEHEAPEKSAIREALQAIAASCEGRGFQLVEVASGWRFQVREDLASWVNRLWEEKPQKYSRALLETLALIAYRQPITRGDIEDVRGVAVSSNIIKTLVEREWIKVVGHRDVPGRPSLYATTRQFLDYFNLKSLDELPSLSELKDIDSLNGSLDLDEEARFAERAGDAESPEDAPDEQEQGEERDREREASGKETEGLGAEVTSADAEVLDEEDDAETLASDTLTQNGAETVPVEEAEMPFELDDEAGSVLHNDNEPEPTAEQEAIAEQEEADEFDQDLDPQDSDPQHSKYDEEEDQEPDEHEDSEAHKRELDGGY